MSNIVIRQAQKDDIRGIAEVHVLSWQKTYRGLMPDEMLDSLNIEDRAKRWERMFDEPSEGVTIIVAKQNEKVVGWSSFGKNRDEDANADTGEVLAIYAHPDYLGIGAGSLMMEYACNQLKKDGYKKATLWVLTTNQNAKNWYEKKGWKNEGKTKMDKRGDHELHETRYFKEL